MKTVAILIPLSWEVVPKQFFFSMLSMMAHSRGKYEIVILTARAAHVAIMHETMVAQAMELDVDYILHLDADEVYPSDTPERMMKHIDDGKDVVFGLVPRQAGDGYVAYEMGENPFRISQLDLKPGSGIVEVSCTGMGGLMVNPEVYRKLDKPYFSGLPNFSGPDVNFCYKCMKKGIKCWLDTDLRFGHIIPSVKYEG